MTMDKTNEILKPPPTRGPAVVSQLTPQQKADDFFGVNPGAQIVIVDGRKFIRSMP
jgi:hypothetical protein